MHCTLYAFDPSDVPELRAHNWERVTIKNVPVYTLVTSPRYAYAFTFNAFGVTEYPRGHTFPMQTLLTPNGSFYHTDRVIDSLDNVDWEAEYAAHKKLKAMKLIGAL